MERGDEPTSFTPYGGGGGGVGGKFRKPTTRKPPLTPYARPVQNQSQRRWLSKLVDPAYRLISGGATRLLPSLFSKSPLSNSPPPSSDGDHDKVEPVDEVVENEDNASGEAEDELCDPGIPTLPGFPGPSGEANRSENSSDFNGHLKDKDDNSLAGFGKFDIEELIKGKTFSRDEVNRLVEIIQSRALIASNKVEANKFPPMTNEKQAEQSATANKTLNMPHGEKQEDLDTAIWGNVTPRLPSSRKVNEVGASPVDIARAYMSNRKSEAGMISDKMTTNDERALPHDDDQMLKPFIPSFSPSSSTCWPGAMSENHRGYLTPRSQRGRFDLQNFPRTPYSRSIYSKPKVTQLQGDVQKSMNTSSPLWKHSRTPAYDQMKSTNDPLDGVTGSIGPIRRLRHKSAAGTHSRGSAYFYPTSQPETKVGSSNTSKGTLLDTTKNLEPGGASSTPLVHSIGNNVSESSLTAVHPQSSSQVARTILEHISRNPPTPKEKNEELKRAIAWKKPPSSGVHSVIPNETNSFASVFDSREKVNQVDQSSRSQSSDEGKNMFMALSKESVGRDPDAVNGTSSGRKFGLTNADLNHGDNGGLKANSTLKEVPKIVPARGSDVGIHMKPSPSIGTKPTFPSITINKNESRWAFSSDSTSSGFSFPVTAASSGLLSEPPTPSIFPSTTPGSNQHLLKPETAIPRYSFGLKKSSPALFFSFPSTNSDTIRNDALNIKFSFGSDDHTRLSFSSVEKDAVCY